LTRSAICRRTPSVPVEPLRRSAILLSVSPGCTTTTDHHYLFPAGLDEAIDIEVAVARELGIRVQLTRGSMNLSQREGGLPPDSVVQDEDTILADSERLIAVVLASLACLIAYITLGRVFSPQYCVWLIPLAALAAPFSSASARRLLPEAFLMVQLEYPFLYGFVYSTLTPAAGVLILVRTAWLWRYAAATLGHFAIRWNWRRSADAPAPFGAHDGRQG